MTANCLTIDIALPLPKGPFTYRVPDTVTVPLRPGMRVRIPFRNEEAVGFVAGPGSAAGQTRLKEIAGVLDDEPVIAEELFSLARWMAEYYHCSIGEVLSSMVPALVRRGRTIKETGPVASVDSVPAAAFTHQLTPEQQSVFDTVMAACAHKQYRGFLLEGVTGSGKSEVYVRLMAEMVRNKRSVICIVPEIALTVHLMNYFRAYFGAALIVLHSKMTDAERFKAWCTIRAQEVSIVLGPRSALFSPVRDLGLIIMDEEHETSFKQEDMPRYHARETAEHLALLYNAVFLMGTATPSLEARFGTETGRFTLLRLPKRIDDRPLPQVAVVDLREEMRAGGNLIISRPLRIAVEQALARKEQVLLFINRRGYSTFLMCMDCGEHIQCPSCNVALTYHADKKKVLCHYCNYTRGLPDECPACRSKNIKYGGVGTERIQSITEKLFPQARIDRLDTDRVRKRGEAERIINRFSRHEIDILIGTQMLAKGFDFPNVTLIGVMNADTMLSIPDFRAFERTFQLLTQVAGRAGRGTQEGRVFVQTFMPENYAVVCAQRHDYNRFYAIEKENRLSLQYPPASKLINIIIRSRNEAKLEKRCAELRTVCETMAAASKDVTVLGPAPLPFYKLRNYFRWHIMLRGQESPALRACAADIVAEIGRSRDTYTAIDVDPMTIL